MAKPITSLPRRPAASVSTASEEASMLPASTELPADVHEKIAAVAKANERSLAAQLRVIAKEWASRAGN